MTTPSFFSVFYSQTAAKKAFPELNKRKRNTEMSCILCRPTCEKKIPLLPSGGTSLKLVPDEVYATFAPI